MSSQNTKDEGSLSLYQVLEEEYVALHGPLPDSYLKARWEIESKNESKESINEELVSEIYQCIHGLPGKRTAFCISGGGIRSATFALGLIQGLARHNLLDKFDYLSTVSGGGYVGSWLEAWIHRNPAGLDGVSEELGSLPKSKLSPEPQEIRHLRNYSNYLSPKLGFLSADAWTLAGTCLRNLTLNWLVLVPLLLGILAIPRLCIAVVRQPPPDWINWLMPVTLLFGLAMAVMALVYIGLNRPSFSTLPGAKSRFLQSHRDQGSFLKYSFLPLMLSTMSLITCWSWFRSSAKPLENQLGFSLFGLEPNMKLLTIFLISGFLIHLIGWVVYSVWLRRFQIWEACVVLATGAVGGILAWWVATKAFPSPTSDSRPIPITELYVCFAAPLLLALFLLAATLFVGLASRKTDDEDREWWARSGAWVLVVIVVWSVFSSFVVFGPAWLLYLSWKMQALVTSVGGVSGLITILIGHSGETVANKKEKKESGWKSTAMNYALALTAPTFVVFLVIALSLLTNKLLKELSSRFYSQVNWHLDDTRPMWYDPSGQLNIIHYTPFWVVFGLFVSLLVIGFGMAFFVNVNKFSLHAMYRNRLIRAYLGASRNKRNRDEREPNPFTGFDPNDNAQLHQLWPENKHGIRKHKLLHVVNAALNLVSGEKLAWQQRKAESFTFTPLHCGAYCVGYRRSKEYGLGKDNKAISLGTAVSISGAAASPNMGYHSSPVVTFLMTLFNARLGWWLGNPGPAGDRTFNRSHPELSIRPLAAEAFGLTNDKNPYIYLSDGGHFENLALYEMVLRRCHLIVVSDAGCDPEYSFEDLGSAINKIRVDMGVPIDFDDVPIYSRHRKLEDLSIHPLREDQKIVRRHCAVGTIRYSCIDGPGTDGMLIYIKPTLCGNEPADVRQYAQQVRQFPHESTSDQWFSESQFESYRMLGSHAMREICMEEGWRAAVLDDFARQVYKYLGQPLPECLELRANIAPVGGGS